MKKRAQPPSDKSSSPKLSTKKKVLWVVLGVSSVILVVTATVNWGIINFLGRAFLTPNYAEQAASPLENALVKAEAVKKCSRGDNGRGMDNTEPNYNARYQLKMNRDDATRLINDIASKNGYNLSPADSQYESIKHYRDDTSKESNYSDLTSGKIKLAISLYNDTDHHALTCMDGTRLQGDETHTAVSLSVVLPTIKQ